jgi:hypothetical protein
MQSVLKAEPENGGRGGERPYARRATHQIGARRVQRLEIDQISHDIRRQRSVMEGARLKNRIANFGAVLVIQNAIIRQAHWSADTQVAGRPQF